MSDEFAHADLERFMQSKDGQQHLANLKASLEGQLIEQVSFANHTKGIAVVLHMSENGIWVTYPPLLELEVLRKNFAESMEIDPSPM